MQCRHAALIVCASALSACTPQVPTIDMSGMTLSRFELFRYGVTDPHVQTTPYRLTPQNLTDIKTHFSANFTDGRTLEFGPISARQKADGSLAICGLVSVRNPDAWATGMKLFDGSASFDQFGVLRFKPNRLADANAKTLDIYTDCRDLGVL
ncbi:hypothetical protein GCM10011390_11170 [Aureimonas endophytica]|uniref:Lipoprotein n=1 Tax=Aureimonas endophytica TaxID=2027858 RepID=A0A917E1W2_9HYPH|nr:hypothetical protein [Aureimonas endophytica]GGD94206.1 hypothetical protein GCM10011390_11170 [Aureimonas endophytica]